MITPRQFEILIKSLDVLSREELEEAAKCFPFENLLNISVLDFELMRSLLKFLKKFSNLDILYKYPDNLKFCWEFILTTLLSLENLPVDDILFNLLETLKYILNKTKTSKEFTFLRQERERVFHILKFTVKLKIFSTPHASLCADILSVLTETNDLPLTTSQLLTEIAEVFIQLQAVQGLILLCNITLNKFSPSTEIYNVCIPWLLNNGPQLLPENFEEDTLLLLLKMFNGLYFKYNYTEHNNLEKFVSNLKSASHHLVFLSSNPILRDESLKLLSILIISETSFKNVDIKEKYVTVLSKLLQLPVEVTQWPRVKSETFFYVCSFLCQHSSLPWSSLEIIESISNLVYSYERFTINKALLKCLCHVYPMVLPENPCKITSLLGDELLIMLSRFPYSFSKVITFHAAQLVWILKQGHPYIKQQILVEWLKKGEDLDLLAKAILQCRVGNILLDIITDWKFNEVADKATEMCHKIQDKELSESVAWRIPTALHNKSMLFKLILSNPGMPSNAEVALKICEFMSLILCFIDDMKVLKAACAYSKYLVTNLRNENNVVALFCRDIKNVQFLAIKVKYVDEETAVEILRLLKVLILVQQRNHNSLEDKVETDLSSSLVGSEVQTEQCLDLLQVMVTSKEVFIKLETSNVLHIFTRLFHMSQDPKMAVKSFVCLTGILRSNEWLAQTHCAGVFVEIQCSISVNETSGPEFLMFLTVWMKILKKSFAGKFYLPDKRVVSNYIQRCNFISQTKATHLLQLLNRIKQFSEISAVKKYGNE